MWTVQLPYLSILTTRIFGNTGCSSSSLEYTPHSCMMDIDQSPSTNITSGTHGCNESHSYDPFSYTFDTLSSYCTTNLCSISTTLTLLSSSVFHSHPFSWKNPSLFPSSDRSTLSSRDCDSTSAPLTLSTPSSLLSPTHFLLRNISSDTHKADILDFIFIKLLETAGDKDTDNA